MEEQNRKLQEEIDLVAKELAEKRAELRAEKTRLLYRQFWSTPKQQRKIKKLKPGKWHAEWCRRSLAYANSGRQSARREWQPKRRINPGIVNAYTPRYGKAVYAEFPDDDWDRFYLAAGTIEKREHF